MKINLRKRSVCLLMAVVLLLSLAPPSMAEEPLPINGVADFDLYNIIQDFKDNQAYPKNSVATYQPTLLEPHEGTAEAPNGYLTFKAVPQEDLISFFAANTFITTGLKNPAISISVKNRAEGDTDKYSMGIFDGVNSAISVEGSAEWEKYSLDLSKVNTPFRPEVFLSNGPLSLWLRTLR